MPHSLDNSYLLITVPVYTCSVLDQVDLVVVFCKQQWQRMISVPQVVAKFFQNVKFVKKENCKVQMIANCKKCRKEIKGYIS